MDIVEFLRARLDEDEAVARECVIPAHEGPNAYKPHPELAEWFYDGDEVEYVQTPEMRAHKYPDRYCVTVDSEGLTPSVEGDIATHIARHDPARVLREVEAKRRVVDEHGGRPPYHIDPCDAHDANFETIPCDTLLALASVYAEHPDFDPDWLT